MSFPARSAVRSLSRTRNWWIIVLKCEKIVNNLNYFFLRINWPKLELFNRICLCLFCGIGARFPSLPLVCATVWSIYRCWYPVYMIEQTSSKRRANAFKIHVPLLDACSMFARSCKRGIRERPSHHGSSDESAARSPVVGLYAPAMYDSRLLGF